MSTNKSDEVECPKCCGTGRVPKPVLCKAVIWHGPGHQSKTLCQVTTPGHEIHRARYGSMDQEATWRDAKGITTCGKNSSAVSIRQKGGSDAEKPAAG